MKRMNSQICPISLYFMSNIIVRFQKRVQMKTFHSNPTTTTDVGDLVSRVKFTKFEISRAHIFEIDAATRESLYPRNRTLRSLTKFLLIENTQKNGRRRSSKRIFKTIGHASSIRVYTSLLLPHGWFHTRDDLFLPLLPNPCIGWGYPYLSLNCGYVRIAAFFGIYLQSHLCFAMWSSNFSAFFSFFFWVENLRIRPECLANHFPHGFVQLVSLSAGVISSRMR